MKTKRKEPYKIPQCALLCSLPASIICNSPSPGALEDITYEDWML